MRWALFVILSAVSLLPAARAEHAAILARNLSDRSQNIAPVYEQFGGLTLCVGTGGFMQWTAKTKAWPHYVHFLYCSGERRPCRLSWAQLLSRVFQIDVTVCPACGGHMKIIAALTERVSIRPYLEGTACCSTCRG